METRRDSFLTQRRRLDLTVDLYLQSCYADRTAARADDLATQLAVSRYALIRFASLHTGTSLRNLLRRKQLAYAKRLLRATPLPIEEIAVASAFGTAWTFTRCFKTEFGITPGEYRQLYVSPRTK